MEKIKQISLEYDGNVEVWTEDATHIVEWETNVFEDHLARMVKAGVVDGDTSIDVPNDFRNTVREWVPYMFEER